MSVTLHTTAGDIKLELYCLECPKTCENFLALCASDYYKDNVFHRNIKDFMVQTGDPTGTGKGGNSIWGVPFADELNPELKHNGRGVLSMANNGPNTNKSQFFILYDKQQHLDLKYTVFGRVIDGFDTLEELETIRVDSRYRPVVEQRNSAPNFSVNSPNNINALSEKIRKMQEYFDQYAEEYVESNDDEQEFIKKEQINTDKSVESLEDIVALLKEQRAKDVVVLTDFPSSSIISTLIICSLFNSRHGYAVSEALRCSIKGSDSQIPKESLRKNHGWFQIDIGQIQVNIMSEEIRQRYDLEGLWGLGDDEPESELPLIPPPRRL